MLKLHINSNSDPDSDPAFLRKFLNPVQNAAIKSLTRCEILFDFYIICEKKNNFPDAKERIIQ